jgi:hypothetical protein
MDEAQTVVALPRERRDNGGARECRDCNEKA